MDFYGKSDFSKIIDWPIPFLPTRGDFIEFKKLIPDFPKECSQAQWFILCVDFVFIDLYDVQLYCVHESEYGYYKNRYDIPQ